MPNREKPTSEEELKKMGVKPEEMVTPEEMERAEMSLYKISKEEYEFRKKLAKEFPVFTMKDIHFLRDVNTKYALGARGMEILEKEVREKAEKFDELPPSVADMMHERLVNLRKLARSLEKTAAESISPPEPLTPEQKADLHELLHGYQAK